MYAFFTLINCINNPIKYLWNAQISSGFALDDGGVVVWMNI
jgi:hypothetical protein